MKVIAIAVSLLFFATLGAQADDMDAPVLVKECRFHDCPIAAVHNQAIRGSVPDDRGLLLGGFSDLYRNENDPAGEFWIVTDRGPNGEVTQEVHGAGNGKRRTFPIPEFAPMILHVKIGDGGLELMSALPLVGRSGKPISGRPNLAQHDNVGYNFAGQVPVPFNPSGIDSEGLVRAADGEFWIAEEYRPSLLKVDARGKVLKRFIPQGQSLPGADYAVADVLPAVYSKRQDNRGFEGLAISSDGKTLYAAMQSPLANPTTEQAKLSRLCRILAFSIKDERPIAEYAYPFDRAEEFNSGSKPDDMKIGAVAALSPGKLLVLERDDKVAKIYRVDLTTASNLLKSRLQGASDEQIPEAAADLTSLGIQPLAKTLVADLSKLDSLPGKLEGLAIIDRNTVATVNDNDFGFEGFDAQGRAIPSGKHSSLFVVRLPQELPFPVGQPFQADKPRGKRQARKPDLLEKASPPRELER